VAYPQPTGFGNISVAFRKFGTQIDFVPIVLGNGSCRLEVRPRISEVDYTLGTTINGTSVPGFRVREADTGVELKFGQTLAIAGLLSQETQVQIKGIPGLMDVPYLGTLFRRTHSQVNEIELLILVQPDLVEGLDPDQVPPCRPGANSLSPVDCEQYFKAYREVPIPPPGGVAGSPLPGPAPADVEPILPPQPTPAIQSVPTTKAPSRGPTALLADESPQPPRPPRIRRPVASPAPAEGETQGDSYNRAGPQAPKAPVQSNPVSAPPGFIGPIGYDVRN
jgi:pilus assembly protein CpaC